MKNPPTAQRSESARDPRPPGSEDEPRTTRDTEEHSMTPPETPSSEQIATSHEPPPTAASEPPEAEGTRAPGAAPGSRAPAELRDDVIAVLKTVYDPEIPVDIYELGLVYEVEVEPTGDVEIVMTLTTPMCPVAETLPPEVEAKVRNVPGVKHVQLDLVWEPPWSMDMMSEAARLELNL